MRKIEDVALDVADAKTLGFIRGRIREFAQEVERETREQDIKILEAGAKVQRDEQRKAVLNDAVKVIRQLPSNIT